MARRPPDNDEGSMDALLDTMMNVVGILIIVLVVTQLGVGDAVKRIGKTIAVDRKTLDEAKTKLAALEPHRDRLRAALQMVKIGDVKDYDQQLKTVREQIRQRQQQLDQLLVRQKEEQQRLANTKQRAAAVTKQIKEDKATREKLQKEIVASQEMEARLKAILADTSPRAQLPPVQVTLPNPRPAPEGASQLTFIASNNLLYPLNLEKFRADGQQAGLRLIQTQRLALYLPVTQTQKLLYVKETERFVQEFNKRPLQDQYFKAEMVAGGAYPRLIFHPIEGRGFNEKSVAGARSRFRQQLARIDRRKYFIRFYVCSDSFDVYVTARRFASELGLLAGWEPVSTDWAYSAGLGGPIRLGRPPKPKPVPPPDAQPKPKPKPRNVID